MVQPINWTPSLVQRFWTGVAQTRLSELSFSKHCADYLIELGSPYLKPEGRHLDFGAGDGDLITAFVKKGYPTAAYEPNYARASRLPREVVLHPKFLGTPQEGQIKPFDVVLMVEVVEHILDEDLDEVFRKVRTFLAKDGVLTLTTPMAEDLDHGSAYCPCGDTQFHGWQHVRSFTAEGLDRFMRHFGFQCEVQRSVDFSYSRLMVEELKTMDVEINRLYAKIAQSFGERFKRLFGGTTEPRKRYPQVSIAELPNHLLYVGRLA